ncbi:hypothetical protein ACOMHN_029805 [Nucella lapillus]
MSGGKFELQSEGFMCVKLTFTHPRNGSVSFYDQDFSPVLSISKLKEDMADKLAVPVELQEWKHRGKVLDDDQTLFDAEVDPDDVIEVAQKPAAE